MWVYFEVFFLLLLLKWVDNDQSYPEKGCKHLDMILCGLLSLGTFGGGVKGTEVIV